MFKIIILILLIMILSACQIAEIQDDWYSFRFDKVKFNNFEEVLSWVINNIDYTSDKEIGKYDYFIYPSETLDYGEGDCEDFAILTIAIIHYQFRYKCNFVIVKNNNKDHAIIRYRGQYYDSTAIGKYKKEIKYAYEYEYFEIPYLISTKR